MLLRRAERLDDAAQLQMRILTVSGFTGRWRRGLNEWPTRWAVGQRRE